MEGCLMIQLASNAMTAASRGGTFRINGGKGTNISGMGSREVRKIVVRKA